MVWRLIGQREASHGVGLVWFGPYLGLTMVAAHMKKASPEARRRKGEASQGKVWFGLELTWEKGGQPRGGLVWFGAYLGLTMVAAHMKKASAEARRRKREANRGGGLVWFGAHLARGRPATRRSDLVWCLPWTHNGGGTHEKGLPGGSTEEEGGQPRKGLVWFGAHLVRGRPATRRSGLVWRLPWTHNGGGTHEKGLPRGAT